MFSELGPAQPNRASSLQQFVVFGPESLAQKAEDAGAELLPLSEAHRYEVQGGPAVVRVVYITHPASPGTLVPFAEYDEKLAQDKLNEALRIFNTLGASHIIAKAYRGRTKSLTARVESKVKTVVQAKGESSSDVAYEQAGTGGSPIDPRPIAYPQEPGFEAACQAVLNNGARRTKIEITKESQFSASGSLGKRFQKFGFSLGIAITSEELSIFVVEATFGAELQPAVEKVPADTSQPVSAGGNWLFLKKPK